MGNRELQQLAVQKIDDQATLGLAGVSNSLAYRIHEIEKHLHNYERWFGISADQSGNDWALSFSAAGMRDPFVATSGNADYGADANDAAKIFGTDDLPAMVGMSKTDIHQIFVTAASVTTIFLLRIIYGSGTMADAITAGQYSEFPILADAAAGGSIDVAVPIMMPRITSGTDKVWIQCKNATDNATISFYVGIHEYAG